MAVLLRGVAMLLGGCGSVAGGVLCPLVVLLSVPSCSRKTPDFDESDLTTLASGYTNASGGEHSCGVDVWGECGRVR